MEKHFATYNQSLALKELGFDESCFGKFNYLKKLEISYCLENTCGYDKHKNSLTLKGSYGNGIVACSAPLKSQVFEWARKEHQIEVTVACFYSKRLGISYEERQYHCHIVRDGVTTKGPKFKTYEEAESALIDKLIEIIKNNLDK